jgi:flagellar basal-body rod protein FlgG
MDGRFDAVGLAKSCSSRASQQDNEGGDQLLIEIVPQLALHELYCLVGIHALSVRSVRSHGVKTVGDRNPLDMVIEGQGFFQVRQPSGQIAYTRAGAFHLNREGAIVTSDGNPLDPQVTIRNDAQTITIGSDGTVSVTQPNQAQAQQVGTVQLANFQNPAGLNSIGHNLFLPTSSSGDPLTGTPGENGLGTINQGFIEQSNVSVVEEMVNMVVGQRAYEINSKVVKTADDMLQTMNNVVR